MRNHFSVSALVFASALTLSIAAAVVTHAIERQRAQVEFDAAARELHQRLEARLEALVALLRGASGLHAALGVPSDELFRTYMRRLDLPGNYPGVLGIGFARYLPAEEVEAFEREAQRALPGFTVRPPPHAAPDAWVIRMLEPLDARNRAALGFDMGSDPTRRSAMIRAVTTGQPALTGRVTLVQEITPDKQAGFLIYVPVYEGGGVPRLVADRRAQALGVSYAPLRAGDFFAPLATEGGPHFEVYAGTEPHPDTLLYASTRRSVDRHLGLPLTAPATGWLVRYGHPRSDTSGSVLTVGGLGLLLSLGLYQATATAERRERERNRVYARDAAVVRAVARLSDAPSGPLAMIERLADWLMSEQLAAGVEVRQGSRLVLQRGAPVGDGGIEHPLAGVDLRIAPTSGESADWIGRVLERAGWVVERAALHEQARLALARNEEALKFANVFVGVLGHDLRNPLNAIGTAAQLLDRMSPEPREQQILRRVRSSVDRMSRLIDQVLDFTRARIGGGIPVQLVETDVADIVADIVGETRIASPGRAIRCRSTGDTRARVDPDRFAQALSNLLGNAVQHGQGGEVEVEVDGTERDAVRLRIHNTGAVPSDLLPLVFDPFRSGTSADGRLGLGMYITRMIVEAHGGDISIDSAPERGTTVRVRVPRGFAPREER